MEEIRNKYLLLFSEIIEKESVILGPDIVIAKAKSIGGLVFDKSGKIINIKGDANYALHILIAEYVNIAGKVAEEVLMPIFEKYPLIKI